jgi:hypothetical protein
LNPRLPHCECGVHTRLNYRPKGGSFRREPTVRNLELSVYISDAINQQSILERSKNLVQENYAESEATKLMKPRTLRLVLFVILLGFALANFAKADYVVGVKRGDWMIYDAEITYLGQTFVESVNLTIQTVEGVLITGIFEVTTQGQEVVPAEQFTLDVSTGIGQSARGFIIPANLTVGSSVPGESATMLNLTDWNGRTALVANASAPFLGYPSQVYWDQATGILLQVSSSSQSSEYRITLVDTSLWNNGFFGLNPTALALLVVAVIVTVLVIFSILVRNRKAKRSEQSASTIGLKMFNKRKSPLKNLEE